MDTSCVKEQLVSVPVVKPFDITAKFFSVKFDPIAKAFAKEPFIVMPYVNCASPFPLVIEDSSVELVSFNFIQFSNHNRLFLMLKTDDWHRRVHR